jgi:hypothetical protein
MRFLGAPVGRRAAVVRTGNGELVVFSPVVADQQSLGELRALGNVAAFVLPSRFHDRFYPGYFREFPQARFLASRAVMQDHPEWPLTELSAEAPELSEFAFTELKGMPMVREVVFLHRVSRTLFIADTLFNVQRPASAFDRGLLRLAGIGNRPSACLLFRTMIRDKKAFANSLREILGWDFERIVPGHGAVIETNGKEILRNVYRRYLGHAAANSAGL